MKSLISRPLKSAICIVLCILMLYGTKPVFNNVKFCLALILILFALLFLYIIWKKPQPKLLVMRIFFNLLKVIGIFVYSIAFLGLLADFVFSTDCTFCEQDIVAENGESLNVKRGKRLYHTGSGWQSCVCTSIYSFEKEVNYTKEQIEKMGDFWTKNDNCMPYKSTLEKYDFPLSSPCLSHSESAFSKDEIYLYSPDSNKLLIYYYDP